MIERRLAALTHAVEAAQKLSKQLDMSYEIRKIGKSEWPAAHVLDFLFLLLELLVPSSNSLLFCTSRVWGASLQLFLKCGNLMP